MRGNAMPVLVSLRITQNTIMKNKKLEQSDFRVHFTLFNIIWRTSEQDLRDEIASRIGTECRVHLIQLNKVEEGEYDATVGLYNDNQAYRYLKAIKERGVSLSNATKSTTISMYKPVVSRVFQSYVNRLEEKYSKQRKQNKRQENPGFNSALQDQYNSPISQPEMITSNVPQIQQKLPQAPPTLEKVDEKRDKRDLQPQGNTTPVLKTIHSQVVYNRSSNPFSLPAPVPPLSSLLKQDKMENLGMKRTISQTYPPQPNLNSVPNFQGSYGNYFASNHKNIPLIDVSVHKNAFSMQQDSDSNKYYDQRRLQKKLSRPPDEFTSCIWAFGIPSEFTPVQIYKSLKAKSLDIKLLPLEQQNEGESKKDSLFRQFSSEHSIENKMNEQAQINQINKSITIHRVFNMEYMEINLNTPVSVNSLFQKLAPYVENFPYLVIPAQQFTSTLQSQTNIQLKSKILEQLSKYMVEINIREEDDNEKKMVMLIDELRGVNMMLRYDSLRDNVFNKYVVIFNGVEQVDKLLVGNGVSWLKKELEKESGREISRSAIVVKKPIPLPQVGRVLKYYSFESLVMEMAQKYRPFQDK